MTTVSVGGGLAYGNLGYSHHAIQDYGLIRLFPEISILSPGDPIEVDKLFEYIMNETTPKYLRLRKSGETNYTNYNENIYVIDFGLSFSSKRLEDKAVDLHLFKEILNSCHSSSFNKLLEQIYSGYKNILGQSSLNAIIDKIDVIESRRRYSKIE